MDARALGAASPRPRRSRPIARVLASPWPPFAAFWALAFGLHLFNWDAGLVRAALLLGAAALALWHLRPSPATGAAAPLAWLRGGVAILALAHVAFCGARLVHVERLPDIASTTMQAAQLAAHGDNPYLAPIDEAAIALDGPRFGGYKYLPVMPLIYAPLALPLREHGMLLANLALDALVAALIFAAARRGRDEAAGLMAAGAYLSVPLVFGALYAKGYTDLAPVVLLLGALIAGERRPFLAGFMFGLSLSAKLMPGLALAPACLPAGGRAAFAAGVALGLVPAALAFLSAPAAVFDNIFVFNFIRPVDSSSWRFYAPESIALALRAGLGLGWLGLAAYALKAPPSLSDRCALAAALAICAILAGPTVHQNYQLWWMPFACAALGARRRAAAAPYCAAA